MTLKNLKFDNVEDGYCFANYVKPYEVFEHVLCILILETCSNDFLLRAGQKYRRMLTDIINPLRISLKTGNSCILKDFIGTSKERLYIKLQFDTLEDSGRILHMNDVKPAEMLEHVSCIDTQDMFKQLLFTSLTKETNQNN